MPLELGTQQVVNKRLLNEGKKRGEAVQGFSVLSFLKRKTGDRVFYYLFYRSFNLLIKAMIVLYGKKFEELTGVSIPLISTQIHERSRYPHLCVSPNSYIKILIPDMRASRCGAFRRY